MNPDVPSYRFLAATVFAVLVTQSPAAIPSRQRQRPAERALSQPARALKHLRPMLKPGGTLTVIEGDHGSTFFHPHSAEAWRVILGFKWEWGRTESSIKGWCQ